MKKKLLITLATATAFLVANPGNSFAAANSDQSADTPHVQTHVYKKVINLSNKDSYERWIQNILEECNIQWKSNGHDWHKKNNQQETPTPEKPEQQPEKEQQPTPAPEKPKQDKEQPAPAPQQPEQQPEKEQQPTENSGYQLNEFEQQVVDLTNQERAKAGLSALKVDVELSKVARIKSQDMKNKGYFSHNSPTYGSPFDMMKQFGINYRAAGENIAMGQRTPQEVVNAWMNSEGHRKNIMNANYTHIGVGYVADGNYWTQQFIGK